MFMDEIDTCITKCIICKSIFHWAKDCPDLDKAEIPPDNEKTVCVTLFNEEIVQCYIESFLGEMFGGAILDFDCIKTVCVKVWFNCYLETSDEKERVSVKAAKIAGFKVNTETDVIRYDLPLLLSKCSIQKANTKLDFENNKITMFARVIDLTFITSGCYCIPLGRLSNAMQQKKRSYTYYDPRKTG